jgi:hypothetical protein
MKSILKTLIIFATIYVLLFGLYAVYEIFKLIIE